MITSENIYLLFIHPKTGSKGSSNTTPEARTRFYKEIIEKINVDDDFYIVSYSGKKVIFTEKVVDIVN